MSIDPMTKMNISLLAIFFMFVCNFLVIFARKLQNRMLSFALKTIAFLLLLSILFMIILVLFV
ncbi:DUF2768 family protein [Brevibacillus fulvus]|uniref:Membrane protein n=1 Tax=Brevibacillus fulvus TaxID=1125967 RepID=A0A938XRT3_9BACL|nr:DUF2768 family protein [Brevibacillus fulvus]MBM7588697.1 putative membrane protein [Brevibacillus fulvus]